jgi:hypothetical protein
MSIKNTKTKGNKGNNFSFGSGASEGSLKNNAGYVRAVRALTI